MLLRITHLMKSVVSRCHQKHVTFTVIINCLFSQGGVNTHVVAVTTHLIRNAQTYVAVSAPLRRRYFPGRTTRRNKQTSEMETLLLLQHIPTITNRLLLLLPPYIICARTMLRTFKEPKCAVFPWILCSLTDVMLIFIYFGHN